MECPFIALTILLPVRDNVAAMGYLCAPIRASNGRRRIYIPVVLMHFEGTLIGGRVIPHFAHVMAPQLTHAGRIE
jgi:hypothetical protein